MKQPITEAREILARYFEWREDGTKNPDYDPDYTPWDAIADLRKVMGCPEETPRKVWVLTSADTEAGKLIDAAYASVYATKERAIRVMRDCVAEDIENDVMSESDVTWCKDGMACYDMAGRMMYRVEEMEVWA